MNGSMPDDPLTNEDKALLEARLAAYEKDPDVGSSWDTLKPAFTLTSLNESQSNCSSEAEADILKVALWYEGRPAWD